MSNPTIDTDHTDSPVCPYCGHAELDAWEIDFGPGLDGEAEVTCGACEREYTVQRHAYITYSSKAKQGGGA